MKVQSVVLLLGAAGVVSAVGIQPVLPLPGGTNTLTVQGMSGNGRYVVGYSSGANGQEAFRWSRPGGTVGLGDFAGGGFASFAHGADFEGNRVVGRATPSIQRGFLWTPGAGLSRLNPIVGGSSTSDQALAISSDGTTWVGQSNSLAFGLRATVWNNSSDGVVLPDLTGGSTFNNALAVNADGSVVVGWGTSGNGQEAMRWVGQTITQIGDLSGGTTSARSTAVNGDGTIVYGQGTNNDGATSWRWDPLTGLTQLGPNAVGEIAFNSEVFGTDRSGRVAVMRAQNQAAIYVLGAGISLLEPVLTAAGVDYSGFDLLDARAISSDGLTIAGNCFYQAAITGYQVELPPTLSWISLHGQINLEDFTPSEVGYPITMELWNGSTLVESCPGVIRDGQFFGWVTNRSGSFTLRVKADHWLAKAIPVTLSLASNANVGTLSLKNGDVNGDNEVGPADFSMLSGAFGSFLGDPTYLPNADLNGDEEVGPGDFSILAANFGEFGD